MCNTVDVHPDSTTRIWTAMKKAVPPRERERASIGSRTCKGPPAANAGKYFTLRVCLKAWKGFVADVSSRRESWIWVATMETQQAYQWVEAFKAFREKRNKTAQRLRESLQSNAREQRDLWQLVKNHLPKAKTRRKVRPAVQMEQLRDKWSTHLCALEAGNPETLEAIYDL